MGTQGPCVFCCETSLTLPTFSTASDIRNGKDVLDVILGVDKAEEAALCVLKEPFRGLPLCGDCDLIYVHLAALVVHLKSIQQKIDVLAHQVKAKAVNSDVKGVEFFSDKAKNGKPTCKVIRENCRRVRNALLKNRRTAVTATEPVKLKVDGEKQKELQSDVAVDLSRVEVKIEVDETPGASEEGVIRIKSLSSLLEADVDMKTPDSNSQDSILIVPDAEVDSASSAAAAPQTSVPKPTFPPMEDDTSSDSDLFRLLTRPNPLRRENLPCPGRKTKGCMQMFCTTTELMEHVMASHTSMNSTVAVASCHRVKKCYFCTINVRNHKDMRRHLRLHTREAPYFCKVCKKDEEKSTSTSEGASSSTSSANERSSFINTEELRRHLHMKHKGLFHKNANLKEVCEEYRTA